MKAYLEPREVESLEGATTNFRDRLLVHLLFRLGCRISEILALKVSDIDLDQQTVTIQHLKFRQKFSCPSCSARLGRDHAFCPKCGVTVAEVVAEAKEHRRVRTLPLDSDSAHMLSDYIQRGGPVLRGNALLIFGVNRHRAWQIVRDCAKRAHLGQLVNPETGAPRGISPHRLRDAFAVMATKANDSGDGLRLLQEHLGHASFNTTAKYRKISGSEHREWYHRLWGQDRTDNG